MANIISSRPAPFGAISTYRLVAGIERAFDIYKSWNEKRLVARTLNSLTDRQLEDIGLVRGDVDRWAR